MMKITSKLAAAQFRHWLNNISLCRRGGTIQDITDRNINKPSGWGELKWSWSPQSSSEITYSHILISWFILIAQYLFLCSKNKIWHKKNVPSVGQKRSAVLLACWFPRSLTADCGVKVLKRVGLRSAGSVCVESAPSLVSVCLSVWVYWELWFPCTAQQHAAHSKSPLNMHANISNCLSVWCKSALW